MVPLNNIQVEVIYANLTQQKKITCHLEAGSTVAMAITHSGILQRFPEIDLTKNKVGIFSKVVDLTHILEAGDRIEIYRPLIVDPKQARLKRASKLD